MGVTMCVGPTYFHGPKNMVPSVVPPVVQSSLASLLFSMSNLLHSETTFF